MVILPDCTNVIKSFEMTLNSKRRREKLKIKVTKTRKTRTKKDENLVLSKEYVENADLDKPLPNKIMNTREECVKYNSVAPLRKKMVRSLDKFFLLSIGDHHY